MGKRLPSAYDMSDEIFDELLQMKCDHYIKSASLIGSPLTSKSLLQTLKAIGVDEIACLVDFGVGREEMMTSIPQIAKCFEFEYQ